MTTVYTTASDSCGNTTNCSFTVTVVPPATPPLVLNCPADITVTNSSATTVYFTVTASGGCSVPGITANPASGSAFVVGTTTVVTTASDECGNTTNCSFTVTVVPPATPPLVLNCPADITVTNSSATTVYFTATASGGCSVPSITANPASGSTFAVGTTTVITTASDECGNTTNCSFTVTVTPGLSPIVITNAVRLGGGAFKLYFTNTPGASFTVLSTTNIPLPMTNWSILGTAVEGPPGQYQFTDPAAASKPRQYYRVRSP